MPTKPEDYGPDLFLDFTLDFLRRHKTEPCFVYHTSVLTHPPHQETPDPAHPGKRLPGSMKSNVEYLDHIVGRLRRGPEEMGAAQNTVIIFLGDNGTAGEGKATVTELGVRVPCILWGPGRVKPAPGASRALGDLTDVMPTLADLAGTALPKDRVFDGKSLVPLMRGETVAHRDWIYSFLDDGRILRDSRWLLTLGAAGKPEHFYNCGECRDGSAYKEVTGSNDDTVKAARERFATILGAMPEPKPRKGVKPAAGKNKEVE